MSEFDQVRVFGSTLDEFSNSLTKTLQSLPREQGDRLHAIRSNCFHTYGFEGTPERLNNKTVGEILAEFGNGTPTFRVTAEGEKDGVRYALTETASDERRSDEGV
jgi:hypothetical protein